MSRLIIGLENNGFQFINDIILYCQVTGHESSPERWKQIYHECLSQIFGNMNVDFQVFMGNLYTLPAWSTIHFLDSPVNYEVVGPFRDAFRAMGIAIYHRLSSRNNLDGNYFYVLESCTETIAIVSCVIDSSEL